VLNDIKIFVGDQVLEDMVSRLNSSTDVVIQTLESSPVYCDVELDQIWTVNWFATVTSNIFNTLNEKKT
jgi:hypothetical protein